MIGQGELLPQLAFTWWNEQGWLSTLRPLLLCEERGALSVLALGTPDTPRYATAWKGTPLNREIVSQVNINRILLYFSYGKHKKWDGTDTSGRFGEQD